MADDNDAAERRRRRSTDMGGISTLPEHLQHEVFSRVGNVKALFKFAATCRGWLHRFTDRAFLRELCPSQGEGSGHRARLLGVFVQDKAMVQTRMTMAASPSSSACLAPVFLPAMGSPLGPAACAISSFIGGCDDDGTFDCAQLLTTRRGIVLLQLAPRTPDEKDRCHLFGVCNPVTGDRHILPPLEWNLAAGCTCWTAVGYAIITAADSSRVNRRPDHPPAAGSSHFTFSQLLVITQDGDGRHGRGVDARIHWYSAATRHWSAPTTCLDRSVFTLLGAGSAVIHRGAAHWLCIDDGLSCRECAARGDSYDLHLYKLSVDVATARVSLTRLPVRVGGKQLLCVNSDDKLVLASVYPVHMTIWTLPGGGAGDDNDDDTTPAAAALLPRTSFRITPYHPHHQWWYNFNRGSLLALFRGGGSDSRGGIFILDLDTKVMEEVPIPYFDNKAMGFLAGVKPYMACMPYEMDLVEFFRLQLGGIREKLRPCLV